MICEERGICPLKFYFWPFDFSSREPTQPDRPVSALHSIGATSLVTLPPTPDTSAPTSHRSPAPILMSIDDSFCSDMENDLESSFEVRTRALLFSPAHRRASEQDLAAEQHAATPPPPPALLPHRALSPPLQCPRQPSAGSLSSSGPPPAPCALVPQSPLSCGNICAVVT